MFGLFFHCQLLLDHLYRKFGFDHISISRNHSLNFPPFAPLYSFLTNLDEKKIVYMKKKITSRDFANFWSYTIGLLTVFKKLYFQQQYHTGCYFHIWKNKISHFENIKLLYNKRLWRKVLSQNWKCKENVINKKKCFWAWILNLYHL